jgi:hypothetical protein
VRKDRAAAAGWRTSGEFAISRTTFPTSFASAPGRPWRAAPCGPLHRSMQSKRYPQALAQLLNWRPTPRLPRLRGRIRPRSTVSSSESAPVVSVTEIPMRPGRPACAPAPAAMPGSVARPSSAAVQDLQAGGHRRGQHISISMIHTQGVVGRNAVPLPRSPELEQRPVRRTAEGAVPRPAPGPTMPRRVHATTERGHPGESSTQSRTH